MATLEWYAFSEGDQYAKVYVDYTENVYTSHSTITINNIRYFNTYARYSHDDGWGSSIIQWSMADSDGSVLSISWNENGVTKTEVMATNLWFDSWDASNTKTLAKTTTSNIPAGSTSIVISLTGTLEPEYSAGSVNLEDLTIGSTRGSSPTAKTVTITYVPVNHKLSVSAGANSSIIVNRTSSPLASASNGALSNGATIYEKDVLKITFTPSTGYNIATHTVNGSVFTSGGSYTVPASLANNKLSVVSTAIVRSYTLSINAGNGSAITVNRTSSPRQGASTGNLSNGETIYHFDILQISVSANDGYNVDELTVNSATFTSGDSHEVTNDVTVSSTASLKAYKLTLIADTGSTITVNRESSLQDGAELGVLANDADIYHFDVLVVTFAVTPEYEILTQTVNGSEFVNGDSYTVIGAVEVATTTRLLGIIYIDNGTKFEKYAVFVDNGTGWDQYIPYIDNGTKFVQYS